MVLLLAVFLLSEHESLVIFSLFSLFIREYYFKLKEIILNGKSQLFQIFGRAELPAFMSHWDSSSVALN